MIQAEKLMEIICEKGILRPRDLKAYNLTRPVLMRLVEKGRIKRVGRGLYMAANSEGMTSHISYAQAAKRIPNGIICLLSALAFHEITTQIPFEIWMGLDEKARKPKIDTFPLRIVRFSKRALSEGIEEHLIEGIPVKITNPARTVADCFKYRNKIGLDVAMEALKDGLRERRFMRDEVWQYAKLCRVTNVIRPYLEAVS